MKHHLFVPRAALMSYTGAQVLIKTVISAEQQSRVTCLTNIKLQSVFKRRSSQQRPFLPAGKSLPLFISKNLYSFIQIFFFFGATHQNPTVGDDEPHKSVRVRQHSSVNSVHIIS